jgi:hypothetical protein
MLLNNDKVNMNNFLRNKRNGNIWTNGESLARWGTVAISDFDDVRHLSNISIYSRKWNIWRQIVPLLFFQISNYLSVIT